MALTSCLNLAVSIDSLGLAAYYKRLFSMMKFQPAQLTLSGLRRMWRKKEYGRIYSGTKTVKQRQRIHARQRMIDGVKNGGQCEGWNMVYSSVVHLKDDKEEKEENCEKSTYKFDNEEGGNKL
jgi:hypothetical protein